MLEKIFFIVSMKNNRNIIKENGNRKIMTSFRISKKHVYKKNLSIQGSFLNH